MQSPQWSLQGRLSVWYSGLVISRFGVHDLETVRENCACSRLRFGVLSQRRKQIAETILRVEARLGPQLNVAGKNCRSKGSSSFLGWPKKRVETCSRGSLGRLLG